MRARELSGAWDIPKSSIRCIWKLDEKNSITVTIFPFLYGIFFHSFIQKILLLLLVNDVEEKTKKMKKKNSRSKLASGKFFSLNHLVKS
jgi:hypothetical protein